VPSELAKYGWPDALVTANTATCDSFSCNVFFEYLAAAKAVGTNTCSVELEVNGLMLGRNGIIPPSMTARVAISAVLAWLVP